jgi:hypothetical protein
MTNRHDASFNNAARWGPSNTLAGAKHACDRRELGRGLRLTADGSSLPAVRSDPGRLNPARGGGNDLPSDQSLDGVRETASSPHAARNESRTSPLLRTQRSSCQDCLSSQNDASSPRDLREPRSCADLRTTNHDTHRPSARLSIRQRHPAPKIPCGGGGLRDSSLWRIDRCSCRCARSSIVSAWFRPPCPVDPEDNPNSIAIANRMGAFLTIGLAAAVARTTCFFREIASSSHY